MCLLHKYNLRREQRLDVVFGDRTAHEARKNAKDESTTDKGTPKLASCKRLTVRWWQIYSSSWFVKILTHWSAAESVPRFANLPIHILIRLTIGRVFNQIDQHRRICGRHVSKHIPNYYTSTLMHMLGSKHHNHGRVSTGP